jgi:hypothetical protein
LTGAVTGHSAPTYHTDFVSHQNRALAGEDLSGVNAHYPGLAIQLGRGMDMQNTAFRHAGPRPSQITRNLVASHGAVQSSDIAPPDRKSRSSPCGPGFASHFECLQCVVLVSVRTNRGYAKGNRNPPKTCEVSSAGSELMVKTRKFRPRIS